MRLPVLYLHWSLTYEYPDRSLALKGLCLTPYAAFPLDIASHTLPLTEPATTPKHTQSLVIKRQTAGCRQLHWPPFSGTN